MARSDSVSSAAGKVRVDAAAYYLPDESDVDNQEYFFGYRITIHNDGDAPVQLLSRHWDIIDAEGNHRVVDGPGVVGEQPVLKPGKVFSYTSFARLETTWGTMEGAYRMRQDGGDEFDVAVGRFYLTMDMHEEPTEP